VHRIEGYMGVLWNSDAILNQGAKRGTLYLATDNNVSTYVFQRGYGEWHAIACRQFNMLGTNAQLEA